jgi:hypothetical protein
MPQLFHRSANVISRVSILALVVVVALAGWVVLEINRSPWITGVNDPKNQPVPFSHKHHVDGLGIDCRYCHTAVEVSSSAGVPPTKTCMNCHSQVWTNAQILEPVRESYRTDRSIQWAKVHDLPDFTYFNHSIHVAKGMGCTTCHGQVDQMPLTWQTASLHMEWCLSCHRQPELFVRPKNEIFNVKYQPPSVAQPVEWQGKKYTDQLELGTALVQEYKVRKLTYCSTCHR